MKRFIYWIFIIAAVVLVWVGLGKAYFGAPYWTVDKAERTVYNSKWAEDHNITDVSCTGGGRYRIDGVTGDPSYKYFWCDFDFLHQFDYMGAYICTAHGRVNTITDAKFDITNLNGLYANGMASECDSAGSDGNP